MTAPAHRPENDGEARASQAPASDHLTFEDLYGLIEQRLSRRKLNSVDAHLDACSECVETLATVLRSGRAASREEQEVLAGIPEPGDDELLEAIRPHLGSAARGTEWKPIIGTFLVGAVLLGLGSFVHNEYWLPVQSRRAAEEALTAMVKLRQATGRLPLRYINEFERAGIVRSGFDTTDDAEQALIFNLRQAVERATEPEAALILGLLLLDDGELDEAERWLTLVNEEMPGSVEALNGLAVVYFERARATTGDPHALHQRGLALLREAERAGPGDLRVLFNYGKFYDAMEMHAAAKRAWERYLQHDEASQWAEEAALQLAQ